MGLRYLKLIGAYLRRMDVNYRNFAFVDAPENSYQSFLITIISLLRSFIKINLS